MSKKPVQEAWTALAADVCGRKHFRRGLPGQDAALAITSPRPFAVVCDGRGSAANSHWGARAAVHAIRRQVTVMHNELDRLLNEADGPENTSLLQRVAEQFYRAAAFVQKECAEERGGAPVEYEFTLLVFLAGSLHGLALHVGDGAIAIEEQSGIRLLSKPDKGEFANQTRFVRYGKTATMRHAWVDIAGLQGVAMFSDGTYEGLVEQTTDKVSLSLVNCWTGMRQGSYTRFDLLALLTDPQWEPRVQDDRCLALLSRRETNAEPTPKALWQSGIAVPTTPEAEADTPAPSEVVTSAAPLLFSGARTSPEGSGKPKRGRVRDLPLWFAIALLLANLFLQFTKKDMFNEFSDCQRAGKCSCMIANAKTSPQITGTHGERRGTQQREKINTEKEFFSGKGEAEGLPVDMHLLIGNSFPLSLIRRPVRIAPQSVGLLREAVDGAELHSFWGHANTAHMAEELLGCKLFRVSERPALTLSESRKPILDGLAFDECWVLSPDYLPGYRPKVGEEVSTDRIQGWQVLRLTWEDAE